MLSRPRFRRILWFTVWQAAASAGLAVLLGLPGAYLLYRVRFRGQRALRAAIAVPFVLPTVVVGLAFRSLTADGGYITRLELEAKLPEDLVTDLVDEIQGDYTGIIAYYRDPETGKEHTLTEGDQSKPRRLRHLYATKATAKRAVDREWRKMTQG